MLWDNGNDQSAFDKKQKKKSPNSYGLIHMQTFEDFPGKLHTGMHTFNFIQILNRVIPRYAVGYFLLYESVSWFHLFKIDTCLHAKFVVLRL